MNTAVATKEPAQLVLLPMTLNEYQGHAMSTLLETAENSAYMVMGMGGEVGEINSLIAKGIRDIETSNEEELLAKLKKELGDVLWFVAGLAHVQGWTLEEVAQLNVSKLKARQANGTLQGSGDDR